MKKFSLFLTMLFAVSLIGCSNRGYDGWKTIDIEGCGTLKIPQEWNVYENEGLLYFTDAESNPIMIQTLSYSGIEDNQQGITESNDFFEEVQNIKILSSAVLSNGAEYGEVLMARGDETTQNRFLSLMSERTVLLVFWDETINEEMVIQIAESYISI